MTTEVERKIVYIDSNRSTIALSNDDCFFDVNQSIMAVHSDDEYIEVVLSEFSTNRNFYGVNSTNNQFSIRYFGTDHIYTLPTGFPNIFDVNVALKNAFQAEFPDDVFNITYLRYTGKISIDAVIKITTTFPTDLSLNFNIEHPANEIMGFNREDNPFTINLASREVSLQSDNPVNVLGNKKELLIRSSLVKDNFENSVDNGLVASDVLAKVPINVQPLENIVYTDNGGLLFRARLSTNQIVGFNMRITDENGDLIGLNSNFLATLSFIRYRRLKEDRDITRKLDDLIEIMRLELIRKDRKDKEQQRKLISAG